MQPELKLCEKHWIFCNNTSADENWMAKMNCAVEGGCPTDYVAVTVSILSFIM
jgi:hypothetical protein